MKIKYVSILLFWFCVLLLFSNVKAQEPIKVLANDNTTVSFFFPSPISKVISPSVNYKFNYTEGDAIGELKGRKGNKSNLTVITANGYIYSFLLEFSEKVQNFNYILSTESAVGKTTANVNKPKKSSLNPIDSEKPKIAESSISTPVTAIKDKPNLIDNTTQLNSKNKNSNNSSVETTNAEDSDLYNEDREEYYRIYCENNYLQRSIIRRSFRQNKGIAVKLNNVLADRNEIYLVMQLENNSKKEYLVNGLGFFLNNDALDSQEILTPLYTFNLQEIIDPESINEVVCVFNKFDMKYKDKLSIVLEEKEGNRMVLLPLNDKQINAPTN